MLVGGDDDAGIGLLDGRGEQFCHGQAGMRCMQMKQAGDKARRSRGGAPDVEGLCGGAEVGMDFTKVGCNVSLVQRGLGKEVDQGRIAFSGAQHGKAAAARRGQHGLADAGHPGRGQTGIKSVAARPERDRCGFGGQLVTGRDSPLRRAHVLANPANALSIKISTWRMALSADGGACFMP